MDGSERGDDAEREAELRAALERLRDDLARLSRRLRAARALVREAEACAAEAAELLDRT